MRNLYHTLFSFQTENKKYRAERTRLIEERNNNYSKIRTLYAKEDEIKKEIAVLRGDISASRKCKKSRRHCRVVPPWYRDEDIVGQCPKFSLYNDNFPLFTINHLDSVPLSVQPLISCGSCDLS